jgi:ATP-dependent phosphoenolpyruvate carboxykinase
VSNVQISSRAQLIAAQIAGNSAEMDAVANRGLGIAKSVAASSRLTGAYISKLGVVTVRGERGSGRTVNDRLIVADDEGAASIEWGRIYRYKGSRRVRWEPGKKIMTTTKNLMGAG